MAKSGPLTGTSVVAHGDDVIAAEVGGEIVALHPQRGFCYGLNRTGSRIWQLAETPIAVSDICKHLVTEFDIDPDRCERDVLGLLAGLVSEGLIVATARTRAAP